MTEALDVVLRLQIVHEGLRIDQAAAEFVEDECHGNNDETQNEE
jgi:hypothetical protein